MYYRCEHENDIFFLWYYHEYLNFVSNYHYVFFNVTQHLKDIQGGYFLFLFFTFKQSILGWKACWIQK